MSSQNWCFLEGKKLRELKKNSSPNMIKPNLTFAKSGGPKNQSCSECVET